MKPTNTSDKPFYSIMIFTKNPKKGQVIVKKKNPHITVKRKFTLKDISEKELADEIKEIKFEFKNQKLMLGQKLAFHNGQKYYSIQPNITASKIHKKIINKINKFADTKDKRLENEHYTPHLSIYDDHKEKYPIFIKVDNLFLAKEIDAENDKWKIIEKI